MSKNIEDIETFDEMCDIATQKIHSALLEGGGHRMKSTVHLWLSHAILWKERQDKSKKKGKGK